MPAKGKLLSDYTPQEWERLRKSLVNPDLLYWATIASLAFLLLLSGFGRLSFEGYRLDTILRIAGGALLVILLAANMIRKMIRWK